MKKLKRVVETMNDHSDRDVGNFVEDGDNEVLDITGGEDLDLNWQNEEKDTDDKNDTDDFPLLIFLF